MCHCVVVGIPLLLGLKGRVRLSCAKIPNIHFKVIRAPNHGIFVFERASNTFKCTFQFEIYSQRGGAGGEGLVYCTLRLPFTLVQHLLLLVMSNKPKYIHTTAHPLILTTPLTMDWKRSPQGSVLSQSTLGSAAKPRGKPSTAEQPLTETCPAHIQNSVPVAQDEPIEIAIHQYFSDNNAITIVEQSQLSCDHA